MTDVIQGENQANFLKLNVKEVEISEPVKLLNYKFAVTTSDKLYTWKTSLE